MAERIYLERTYGSPEAAIIQPEKQIPVTAYNVDNWLPRLGVQRWALVQVLRRLALDAPQAADGTRRLETTREELAQWLGIAWPGTIGEWLKSEPIPGRKGWRRISPVDEAARALAHFIPRLRYTYSRGEDGKTRRTGLALYIRMDEPLIPEDEARLDTVAAAMIQERVEQGLLVEPTQDVSGNPASQSVKEEIPISQGSTIKSEIPISQGVKEETPISQTDGVKGQNSISQTTVKEGFPTSQPPVKGESPSSQGREIGKPYRNVNERTNNSNKRTDILEIIQDLVENLDLSMRDGRRIRAQLTPLVKAAEDLLDDYHSTQMLYKVLKMLYRTQRLDLFLQALGTAVEVGELDASANLGAVFVAEIKRLGQEEEVDIGLALNAGRVVVEQRSASEGGDRAYHLAEPDDRAGERPGMTPSVPEFLVPGYGNSRKLWDIALEQLELQMTQATFNTWLRATWIVDYQSGDSDDDGAESSAIGECFTIRAASPYAVEWLANRLAPMIVRTLSAVVGRPVRVEFVVGDQAGTLDPSRSGGGEG